MAVLAALPLLKKGVRSWIIPAWVMTGLCWRMTGLLRYEAMWSNYSRQLLPYRRASIETGRYFADPWSTWATLIFALILTAIWVALCCLRLRRAEQPQGGKTGPLHGA